MKKASVTTLTIMVAALSAAGIAQRPVRRPVRKAQPAVVVPAAAFSCLTRIDAEDWGVLLADVRASNPAAADRLSSDPALRQRQVDSLRELLAYSCQAVKEGVSADARNAREINNIRREVTASNYDKIKNPAPDHEMFSAITSAQIDAFYAGKAKNAIFEQFLEDKLSLMREADPANAGHVPTPAETEDAKKVFAQISIYEAAFDRESPTLSAEVKRRVTLQVALQQAQFLARLYTKKIADKMAVSDDEVKAYVAKHPELDADKRAKAEDILRKARTGEDFGALADKFSEDPGNDDPSGKKHGGLYADVPKGRMIKPFEDAALSLKPGQVYPELVQSQFGYHIIKLDKLSGTGDNLTYDVRHVLISTTVKDPDNPNGREIALTEFVRDKIQNDKENAIVAKVLLDNPIAIAPFPITAAVKPAVKADH